MNICSEYLKGENHMKNKEAGSAPCAEEKELKAELEFVNLENTELNSVAGGSGAHVTICGRSTVYGGTGENTPSSN